MSCMGGVWIFSGIAHYPLEILVMPGGCYSTAMHIVTGDAHSITQGDLLKHYSTVSTIKEIPQIYGGYSIMRRADTNVSNMESYLQYSGGVEYCRGVQY